MAIVWNTSVPDLRPDERLPLLRIADFIRSSDGVAGTAWPSIRRLARDCGLSHPAMVRIIQRLVRAELLEVVTRGAQHRSTVYRLNVERLSSGNPALPLKTLRQAEKARGQRSSCVTSAVILERVSGNPALPDPEGAGSTSGSTTGADAPVLASTPNHVLYAIAQKVIDREVRKGLDENDRVTLVELVKIECAQQRKPYDGAAVWGAIDACFASLARERRKVHEQLRQFQPRGMQ